MKTRQDINTIKKIVPFIFAFGFTSGIFCMCTILNYDGEITVTVVFNAIGTVIFSMLSFFCGATINIYLKKIER